MSDKLDRTLRIEIPPSYVSKLAPDPAWTAINDLNGWNTIPGTLGLIWEGTIDLSGYARDYKTFYPIGGVVQEGSFQSEIGGGGTIVYYVMSSTPLPTPLELVAALGLRTSPGFMSSQAQVTNPQNWNTVLFAESHLMVNKANITPNPVGIQQTIEVKQSGSLSPTATSVIYCAKVVVPLTGTMTTLGIPASRMILPGTMDQEPELEYMMRLSRSIELANQV